MRPMGPGFGRRMERPDKPPEIRKLWSHFGSFILAHRWAIMFGTGCVVFGLMLGKLNPLIIRFLVDRVFTPITKGEWTDERYRTSLHMLFVGVGIMLGVSFFSTLVTRFRMRMMRRAGATMIRDLRLHVYGHLQKLSLRFYEARQTGDIMSRITGDVAALERLITQISDRLLTDVLNILVSMVILFYLDWRLALIALIPIPILVGLMYWFGKIIRPVFRQVRDEMGQIHAKLQDNISGIRVIKAFNTEGAESNSFAETNNSFYDVVLKEVKLSSNAFPLIRFVDGLGVILVTAAGGYMLIQPNATLTLGDLFAFNAYVLQLYHPIGALFQMYNVILQSLASGERVAEILDVEPDVKDAVDAAELPTVTGHICFSNVSFAYNEETPVLKNISVDANPGDIIALVGPSGTGKTSMINLILRFYDPQEGSIKIDGLDISKVKQASLRSQIAVVLQDAFLFNGSVLENIRYAYPEASMAQVEAAAKAAYADEFIDTLPNGYDTEIGERGVKLSGGQKQRLAIARALLADRRILILDEATSMIDSHAEFLIQKALNRLMEDRTTFVIAHRLSTIKHANKILVIQEGEVVEAGSHQELMDKDGTYATMYKAQYRLDFDGSQAFSEYILQNKDEELEPAV